VQSNFSREYSRAVTPRRCTKRGGWPGRSYPWLAGSLRARRSWAILDFVACSLAHHVLVLCSRYFFFKHWTLEVLSRSHERSCY